MTDIRGVFHPIAFMITSHETESDFYNFYQGLIKLANELDLEYNPNYIMQDAWPASLNAANRCFPDCVVLMCYFHVKENIRKHRGLVPEDILEEIMSDISDIHMAVNEKVFAQLLVDFKS